MLNNRLPKVKGTKKILTNNQLIISTGLPSLDTIIGGGIPVSSLFLLEEDEFGVFSKIIMKHFIAEGVTTDHMILFVSEEIDSKKIVKELPAPITEKQSEKHDLPNIGDLTIAWRYQDLPNAESSEPSPNLFGHSYDMSQRISSSVLDKAEIKFWNSDSDPNYQELFNKIQSILKEPRFDFSAPVENRTVLRIVLHLLGTPLWKGDFVKFLIKLRVSLRNKCCSCFITVAPNLFERNYLLHRVEHLCDTVIRVQSLLNDGNPAYSDYDGLLFLDKLPIINNWNSYIPESNDWAFKSKKRHFRIEKLHISPDIKETVHREGEDVSKEYETQKIISNVANQF